MCYFSTIFGWCLIGRIRGANMKRLQNTGIKYPPDISTNDNKASSPTLKQCNTIAAIEFQIRNEDQARGAGSV